MLDPSWAYVSTSLTIRTVVDVITPGGCDRQCPSLQTDFGMCLQLQPSWGTWLLDVLPTHIRGISSYVHPGLWDFPVCPYPFRFQHPSFLPWP